MKCRRPIKHVRVSWYKTLNKSPEMSASSLLLFGLGRLSTLFSFSVRLKISLWRCWLSTIWSPSGICSQIRSAYMGGVSAVLAQLVVPARPVQNMPKCRRPSKCRRPPTFWPFFSRKVKILTRLISVLSLPFEFVQNHKSCPNSAASLLSL